MSSQLRDVIHFVFVVSNVSHHCFFNRWSRIHCPTFEAVQVLGQIRKVSLIYWSTVYVSLPKSDIKLMIIITVCPYGWQTSLLQARSWVELSLARSSSWMSSCGPGNGVRPPRLKENVLLTPRRLIAKFRSLEGNRGVFFLISVSSFTDNPSSQTIVTESTRERAAVSISANSTRRWNRCSGRC